MSSSDPNPSYNGQQQQYQQYQHPTQPHQAAPPVFSAQQQQQQLYQQQPPPQQQQYQQYQQYNQHFAVQNLQQNQKLQKQPMGGGVVHMKEAPPMEEEFLDVLNTFLEPSKPAATAAAAPDPFQQQQQQMQQQSINPFGRPPVAQPPANRSQVSERIADGRGNLHRENPELGVSVFTM